jgi:hypothetical protein
MNFINKLKAIWSSLPHRLQAAILFGASAAVEAIAHVIEEGQIPSTLPAIKHLLGSALVTGAAAAYAFYRLPNRTPAPVVPSLPPDVPKAG